MVQFVASSRSGVFLVEFRFNSSVQTMRLSEEAEATIVEMTNVAAILRADLVYIHKETSRAGVIVQPVVWKFARAVITHSSAPT